MIGYYVHHQGRGHLHRALAVAEALPEPVTGLSSLPRPDAWRGPWVQLARDDEGPATHDVSAGGQLHWVPLDDAGLRSRTAAISAWIESARPRLVVVDVSVEVTVLVRLHGVPVVSLVLPGRRTDPAHLLGLRTATALVAVAPPSVRNLHPGLPVDVADRVHFVGAVSRFPVTSSERARTPGPRRVVVLQGQGGGSLTALDPRSLRALAPGWEWTLLGGPGSWVEDPSAVLREADVVVTNAGQGALADVAAHRRPAIVVPADRPFDEQRATAAVLADGRWPAVVLPEFPTSGWEELLDRAARLDGSAWDDWCDGHAAERLAALVVTTADSADRHRPHAVRSA